MTNLFDLQLFADESASDAESKDKNKAEESDAVLLFVL